MHHASNGSSASEAQGPTSAELFEYTVFPPYDEPQGTRRHGTYRELVERLRIAHDGPKKSAGSWSPATFKHDYRDSANVLTVRAVGFDVDEAKLSASDLRAKAGPYLGFFHSTSSHTPTSPRWRLVLVLSRPVDKDEYTRVWRALATRLPFNVAIGKASKDASRQWYLPTTPIEGEYVFEELQGARVDVEALLEQEPPEQEDEGDSVPQDEGSNWLVDVDGAAKILAPYFVDGRRHQMAFELAGACAWSGVSQVDALELLCRVASLGPCGNEEREKRSRQVRRTYVLAKSGAKVSGWPSLEKRCGSFAVQRAKDVLFQRDRWRSFSEARRRAANDAEVSEAQEAPDLPSGLGFTYGAWSEPPPPIKFLVEGLLPSSSVSMLFGHADSLKTWIAFSLAIAIASGTPWLGKYPTKGGRVGLVDYETGKTNAHRRLYMLGAGTNDSLGARSFPTLKPNEPAFWTELEKERFDLVIVDSLRRANPGANENDSAEAIVPLELAAEFSEKTGCAVLFIHHAKKANDDGWPEHRGSAAIKDQVDCSFVVKKEDVSAFLKRVDIRCDKPGDMPTPDPFAVEVVFNDVLCKTTVRLAGQAAPTNEQGLEARLLAVIENGNFRSTKDLRKQVGKALSLVVSEIRGLEEARRVVKIDGVYRVDTPERARARIVAEVTKRPKSSMTAIAKGASVADWQVRKALDESAITETSKGWFAVP